MNVEKYVKEYLKELENQEQEYVLKIKEIRIKKCGLNEFLQSYKQTQNELIVEAKNNTISNNFLDEIDAKKINLFLEYLDKVGDVEPIKIIKKKMPKMEYYIYNKKKRLWNNYQEFIKDFNQWINKEGKWKDSIV